VSAAPTTTDIGAIAADPEKIASVMKRLDGQVQYHEEKSAKSQRRYKRIKKTGIVAAALIPFLAVLHVADAHAYVKTILPLNQYRQLWTTSRSAVRSTQS
jgi:hypothetical protein